MTDGNFPMAHCYPETAEAIARIRAAVTKTNPEMDFSDADALEDAQLLLAEYDRILGLAQEEMQYGCPYIDGDECLLEKRSFGPCLCANPVAQGVSELDDLRKANQILHALLGNREADARRLRNAILSYLDAFDACGGSESVSAERFADARHALREAVAEVLEPAQAVLDGWTLVPIEPTKEMIQASIWALDRWREKHGNVQGFVPPGEKYQIRWRAMLAAAPSLPSTGRATPESVSLPAIAPRKCFCCKGDLHLNGASYSCDQQSTEHFHIDDLSSVSSTVSNTPEGK